MKTLIKSTLYILLLSALVFAKDKPSKSFNKSFNVSSKGTLTISLRVGNITIETWNKPKVTIISNNLSESALDDISITREGDNIEFDFYGSSSRQSLNIFTFVVPENFNIVSKTNSGDIELFGQLKGNFEGNTSGGNFALDDIEGNVNVHSGGGDLDLQFVGGILKADTFGGDIDVEDVNGKHADIKTKGGSINVGRVKGELSAHTYGGDIRIDFAGNHSEILTYGGDIRLVKCEGNIITDTRGGDVKVYNAKGFIEARTNGGDLVLKNIIGGVDARTNAGSIYAQLSPEGKLDSELRSLRGDIELVIPSKSNIAIDAKIRSTLGKDLISSDFEPVTYKNRRNTLTATYKTGNGKNRITLSTVSSEIKIKKLKTRGRK
ncbi:MAG: DUF4097 domain-containing protein [Rhodothermaceae bacterium]